MSITPKTFDILSLLVTNRGLLVKKDDLMNQVWPDQFVDESSVTQNIYVLRKVLGEDKEVRYIETVPRAGYRFVAKVKEVFESPETLSSVSALDDKTGWLTKLRTLQEAVGRVPILQNAISSRLSFSVMALIVTAAIIFGSVLLVRKMQSDLSGRFRPKSLAVLPFRSVTVGEEEDPLGIGMADATIRRLSNSGSFSVLPTTSVLKFRGEGVDPLKAGRELGVDSVLSGTIQKSGGRVRVSVQVLSVADGTVRWSSQFDERLADLFTMQDSLSNQLAEALALRAHEGANAENANHHTVNVEAYQYYLIGLNLWNKRTPQSLYKAVEYFQKATEQDPHYALAYACMADAYSLIARDRFGPMPASEAWHQARASATKAIELDDRIGEAYTAMAMYKLAVEKDFAAADELYKRALSLTPGSAVTHLRYGWFLIGRGNLEYGVAELRRAQELDPISPTTNAAVASSLLLTRQYDQSIVYARRALDIDPENPYAFLALCEAYAYLGRHDEARATLEKVKLYNEDSTAVLEQNAFLHALAGRKNEALKALAQLEQLTVCSPVDRYNIASTYAVLGQSDQAFYWLNTATRLNIPALKFHPSFDSLRSDPRFVEITQHGPKMLRPNFSPNSKACTEFARVTAK